MTSEHCAKQKKRLSVGPRLFEPAYEKNNKMAWVPSEDSDLRKKQQIAWAPSEDSDQPGHLPRLI